MAEWMTVAAAAELAGVSARTMRRWAKNGQVRSRRRGRVHLIDASESAATVGHDGHPLADDRSPPAAMADEASHLAALVRELSASLAEQSAIAAMWQGRADVLAQRVRMLEAPQSHQMHEDAILTAQRPDAPSGPSEPPSPAPMPPTPNGQGAAPWWRRWWWGGLL
jgi:excisionase family DNA binding protein